jgi:hypothetical protein
MMSVALCYTVLLGSVCILNIISNIRVRANVTIMS